MAQGNRTTFSPPAEIGTAASATGRSWYGSATVTSGVATFYPTADGLSNGTALFATIRNTQATAQANTATGTLVPIAVVKVVAADRKSVTVNVIVAGVAGGVAAADGTVVNLAIRGDV